jgi:hypothetical protein
MSKPEGVKMAMEAAFIVAASAACPRAIFSVAIHGIVGHGRFGCLPKPFGR